MNTEETKKLYDQYLMATYKPTVVISKAKGSRVYDASGKQYYDMTSGIGVHNVGHCTEGVVKAVQDQVAKLGHCSLMKRLEQWPSFATWSCTALTTPSVQWPTLWTPIPLVMS